MMTLFSVAPVCHEHGGGCGVWSETCRSGDSAIMGRDRDCREHQPTVIWCSEWSAGWAYISAPAASGVSCTGSMSHNHRGGWWERVCPVHLELCGLPDVVLSQDASLQAAKNLAGLADPGADLLVEVPVTADHATEVFEVVDRLQLGAINRDGGSVGNCGRCWLKQEPCLAEADGETEEAGGFCKLVHYDLEVRLPMRNEGAVVSKQCFQDNLFQSLTWLPVGEGRTGSRQADIVGTLPVQGPWRHGLARRLRTGWRGREPAHTLAWHRWRCWRALMLHRLKYLSCHVVMELANQVHELIGHSSLNRITQRASLLAVSKAFVRCMKTATRSTFCSIPFSCTWRTEIMSVVLRSGRNPYWASGRFFLRDVGCETVEDDPSRDLPSDGQERDVPVVAAVSLTAPPPPPPPPPLAHPLLPRCWWGVSGVLQGPPGRLTWRSLQDPVHPRGFSRAGLSDCLQNLIDRCGVVEAGDHELLWDLVEHSGDSDITDVFAATDGIVRFHCFDLGCIHVVLNLSAWRNRVSVMVRSFSAQKLNNMRPFEFSFPVPLGPSTPFQLLQSVSTLALKCPSRMSLSLGRTSFTRALSSS